MSLPRDNEVINQVHFCFFPGSSYSKNVWWNTWNRCFKVLLSTFFPQTTQRMTLGCSTFEATKTGEWSGREGLRGSGWMSPVNTVKFTTEDWAWSTWLLIYQSQLRIFSFSPLQALVSIQGKHNRFAFRKIHSVPPECHSWLVEIPFW